MKTWKTALFILLTGAICIQPVWSQKSGKSVSEQTVQKNPKMQYMGKFDAGVPNAGIYKMYDASDDIVCYILMPELPVTKKIPQGVMYEGNSLGSISCVKVKVHVVPISSR